MSMAAYQTNAGFRLAIIPNARAREKEEKKSERMLSER